MEEGKKYERFIEFFHPLIICGQKSRDAELKDRKHPDLIPTPCYYKLKVTVEGVDEANVVGGEMEGEYICNVEWLECIDLNTGNSLYDKARLSPEDYNARVENNLKFAFNKEDPGVMINNTNTIPGPGMKVFVNYVDEYGKNHGKVEGILCDEFGRTRREENFNTASLAMKLRNNPSAPSPVAGAVLTRLNNTEYCHVLIDKPENIKVLEQKDMQEKAGILAAMQENLNNESYWENMCIINTFMFSESLWDSFIPIEDKRKLIIIHKTQIKEIPRNEPNFFADRYNIMLIEKWKDILKKAIPKLRKELENIQQRLRVDSKKILVESSKIDIQGSIYRQITDNIQISFDIKNNNFKLITKFVGLDNGVNSNESDEEMHSLNNAGEEKYDLVAIFGAIITNSNYNFTGDNILLLRNIIDDHFKNLAKTEYVINGVKGYLHPAWGQQLDHYISHKISSGFAIDKELLTQELSDMIKTQNDVLAIIRDQRAIIQELWDQAEHHVQRISIWSFADRMYSKVFLYSRNMLAKRFSYLENKKGGKRKKKEVKEKKSKKIKKKIKKYKKTIKK